VVKAAARDHDYRFDMPAIGPDTIEIAAAGGASVVALEAGRVLVVDRERCLRIADTAGMAVVGVE
jgi:UDP-2,3-diacylglucosamine hydrolase